MNAEQMRSELLQLSVIVGRMDPQHQEDSVRAEQVHAKLLELANSIPRGRATGAELERLDHRTDDICAQLTRYGGAVYSQGLVDALDAVTDLNDDMHHMRAEKVIRRRGEQIKHLVDAAVSQHLASQLA